MYKIFAHSFLNNIKENWETSAKNLSCPFFVYIHCVFVSFQKQLDFRTKRIGALLWVFWLFSVHVSLAIPLFKQSLLYEVYEVEPRANIFTVSYSELTPANPPFCTALAEFNVKLFPFFKGLTVPFSKVTGVPWLHRASELYCQEKSIALQSLCPI